MGIVLSKVIDGTGAHGDLGADPEIARVTGDSREVTPGTVFFALPGAKADGHAFAAEAARRGAVAVVAERKVDCAPALLLLAPSARRAMAVAAANFLGRPGDALKLAGVTGTNGKTTITFLVEACAQAAGLPSLKLRQNVEWAERETVRRALDTARGVKKDAAEIMGISQRAMSYYLAKYPDKDGG